MALRKDQTLNELADVARLIVRSGYLPQAEVLTEVGSFVRAELDDEQAARDLTAKLVDQAEAELSSEAQTWPARTDNDALDDVLNDLGARGYLLLEYCRDHFDATAALRSAPDAAGIVFFTETDVWHAISERMLELKVWHADTSNVVAADPELAMVLGVLQEHGLAARFDEGRIEVTLTWRRRRSR
ncbi:MAG TPA: hypothetical protein VFP89_08175 [Propionibacteriaceae bacterium]|nr:hypothetical protein [Propionibacteriaceae bacterium]